MHRASARPDWSCIRNGWRCPQSRDLWGSRAAGSRWSESPPQGMGRRVLSRPYAHAGSISKDLGLPFVLARKPGKLPNESYSKEFDLEYGRTSIEIQKNTSISSKDRVVIIDDLVATGGTAIACAELLTENFGVLNENILVLAVIDLPDLGGSKLITDQGYSLETLVGYSDS